MDSYHKSGLAKIKNVNYRLVDYLAAINPPERRTQLYMKNGLYLQKIGVPNKSINLVYLQLAEAPSVNIEKLPEVWEREAYRLKPRRSSRMTQKGSSCPCDM